MYGSTKKKNECTNGNCLKETHACVYITHEFCKHNLAPIAPTLPRDHFQATLIAPLTVIVTFVGEFNVIRVAIYTRSATLGGKVYESLWSWL